MPGDGTDVAVAERAPRDDEGATDEVSTQPSRPRTTTAQRAYAVGLVLIVVLAGAVRVIPLVAGVPYSHYVDEGHVVRASAHVIADGTWDPDFYDYPSGLIGATAVVASSKALVTGDWSDFRAEVKRYDREDFFDPMPTDLLLSARVLVLLSSLGVVLLVAHLGRKLGGRTVGLLAGLLAAVLPALATRSATATVDAPAALFVLASIACAIKIRESSRAMWWAVAAGAFAGMAIGTKYTVGIVVLAVAVGVLLDRRASWPRRAAMGAASGASAAVCFFLASPAFVLENGDVTRRLSALSEGYADKTDGSYLSEVVSSAEAGWVFVVLALAGLVYALVRPRRREVALVLAAFAVPFFLYMCTYSFQPFRNIYPVLAIACATAALAVVEAVRWATGRIGWSRPWPQVLSGAVAVLLVVLLLPAGLDENRKEARVVDSRAQARAWFADLDECGSVLIAREVGFHPDELDDFGCDDVQVAWATRDSAVDPDAFDYVVTSEFAPDAVPPEAGEVAAWAQPRWVGLAASFGDQPIDKGRYRHHRTTHQAVVIYRNP